MLNLLLAILNFLVLLLGVYWSFRKKSFSFLFYLALTVIYGIPGLVDAIAYNSYRDYTQAFLFSIGFTLCVVIAHILSGRLLHNKMKFLNKFNNPDKPFLGTREATQISFALLLAGTFFLFLDVYVGTGLLPYEVFAADWHVVGFSNRTFLHSIGVILFTVGSSAFIMAIIFKRWVIVLLSFLICVYVTMGLGIRFFTAPMFAPVLLYYLALGNVKPKKMLAGLLIGVLFTFGVFMVQTMRWEKDRTINALLDPLMYIKTYNRIVAMDSGEFSLRYVYYYLVNEIPETHEPGDGSTYLRLFLMPIPSSVIPDIKPTDFTQTMYDYFYDWDRGRGGTAHPLLFGDAWANFMWLGVFVGLFWGMLFGLLDRILNGIQASIRYMFMAPITTFMFFLARGAVYSSVTFIYYGFILITMTLFAYYVFKRLFNKGLHSNFANR